jgi:hypothetical protein
MLQWRHSPTILGLGTTKWRWVVSFTLRPLTPAERARGTPWIRDWVDPNSNLEAAEKKEMSFLCQNLNPDVHPIACRYTDWANKSSLYGLHLSYLKIHEYRTYLSARPVGPLLLRIPGAKAFLGRVYIRIPCRSGHTTAERTYEIMCHIRDSSSKWNWQRSSTYWLLFEADNSCTYRRFILTLAWHFIKFLYIERFSIF